MADVNAAIGLAQIREYPELLKERKRVFNIYSEGFADCDWALLPPSVDREKESSYHIYALRIKGFTEEQRDHMIDEIAKSEVAVNVHFIPMPMLSFFIHWVMISRIIRRHTRTLKAKFPCLFIRN